MLDLTKPLIRRDGKPVKILTTTRPGQEPYTIVAMTTDTGELTFHQPNGTGHRSGIDLINPEPKTHTLKLTSEELITLKILCENVGGHPETTARGFADAISEKIDVEYLEGNWLDENTNYFQPGTKTLIEEMARELEAR